MNVSRKSDRVGGFKVMVLLSSGLAWVAVGCGPTYRDLRREGQMAMLDGSYGPARIFFRQAEDVKRRRVENLHDMGVCSVMLAKEKFTQMNYPAAMREVDAAIDCYTRAIDELPGHLASLEGKNIALELKGQFDAALKQSEWAVKFVGPSGRQYLFLARELEERGDKDGAFLRYRQAVAVDPNSAETHRSVAKFLLANRNESAALVHLNAAHRLDPKDSWVAEQLSVRRGTKDQTVADLRTP